MKKITAVLLQVFIITTSFAQNVGIGIATPISKLHVSGTENNIATFAGGTPMYITLTEDGINRGYIGSFAGSAEDVDFGTYNGSPGKVHLTSGNNVPRLTVMANGNVGIGTVSPEQLFSVAAGMVIDQDNLNTGTVANTLRFGGGSGEGIGSKRNSGTNQWGLDFYTNSIHRMTIANNGNIGIGTTTPQAKLDVNGDVNIENRLLLNNSAGTAGQALISNGAGTAPTWKNTSFSNNDRFLFQSLSNLTSDEGQLYDDTLIYNIVYAYSSAITYNNGVFTINKSGLYRIESSFSALLITGNESVASAGIRLVAANSLSLGFEGMTYAGLSGGTQHIYGKTFTSVLSLYFTAGSTFYFKGTIGISNPPIVKGFSANGPVSINLVSE